MKFTLDRGDIIKKTKRKISKKREIKKIIPLAVIVIFLITIVLNSTNLTIKQIFPSIATKIAKDAPTFNYVEHKTNLITIENKYKIKDSIGKKLSNNIYDFEINTDKNNISNQYEIQIEKISSTIDTEYIMFYLTDNNDKRILNFNKEKSYNELVTNNDQNKILYTGQLTEKNQKLRLRYWINNNYNSKDKSKSFSFRVKIVAKN